MRKPRLVLAALVVPASFTIAASAPAGDHGITFRDYDSGHGWTGSDHGWWAGSEDDQCAKPLSEREGGWTCYVSDRTSDDSTSTPGWRR